MGARWWERWSKFGLAREPAGGARGWARKNLLPCAFNKPYTQRNRQKNSTSEKVRGSGANDGASLRLDIGSLVP
jgi:hypothetical protein